MAPTIEKRRGVGLPAGRVPFREPVRLTPRRPIEKRPSAESLVTYLLGSLLFWTLWGAISISAHPWYWWPIVPLAGWTAVLAIYVSLARRSVSR